jgi:hypothetical protein
MAPIPHSLTAALIAYAAPLAAFVVASAVWLAARGRAWAGTAGGLGLLAGWALLLPIRVLPRAIWASPRGVEVLVLPALVCVAGVALTAWRGGRQGRLIAVVLAGFAGWWVARNEVGTAEFWRVWFAIAGLTWVVARVCAGRAERFLVLALALWGGLAVAGTGAAWLMAAAVAVSAAAGLLAAGADAALPAAAVAALLGVADLAHGRLLRGRLDTIDLACVAALAAPFVAAALAGRLGRMSDRLAPVLAGVVGAGATVVAVWVLRRAFFT